jgi:hypothetical protein
VIVRYVDGRTLVDCAALFAHFQRRYAMPTLRARCQVVMTDPETGRQLFDVEEAERAMAGVRPRAPHKRRARFGRNG